MHHEGNLETQEVGSARVYYLLFIGSLGPLAISALGLGLHLHLFVLECPLDVLRNCEKRYHFSCLDVSSLLDEVVWALRDVVHNQEKGLDKDEKGIIGDHYSEEGKRRYIGIT